MMCKILLLLAFAQLAFSCSYSNLDEYLKYVAGLSPKESQNENRRLKDKVKQLAEKYRPDITQGFPDLNIPILDPLKLGDFKLGPLELNKNSMLRIANFNHVQVKGLKDFILSGIQLSVNKLEFGLNITIPVARVDGDHELNGTLISLLPAEGNGPFFVEFHNFFVSGKGSVKAGSGHISVDNFDINLDAENIDLRFDGILGENAVMINRILTKNAKTLFRQNFSKLGKLAAANAKPPINEFLKTINIDKLIAEN